jgi:hypothetical protein
MHRRTISSSSSSGTGYSDNRTAIAYAATNPSHHPLSLLYSHVVRIRNSPSSILSNDCPVTCCFFPRCRTYGTNPSKSNEQKHVTTVHFTRKSGSEYPRRLHTPALQFRTKSLISFALARPPRCEIALIANRISSPVRSDTPKR